METQEIIQFLQPVSGVVLLVFLVIFTIVSVVLHYHWTNYGIGAEKINKVRFWYFGVSFILFFTMTINYIFTYF
ncbi:MAG: hypothetical protein Q7S10_01505 [bacterium]|nr:hypothetical protein [bacterium]